MSTVIRPEIVIVEEREKSEYNAAQSERRRVALAILPAFFQSSTDTPKGDVQAALNYADLLIAATEYKK